MLEHVRGLLTPASIVLTRMNSTEPNSPGIRTRGPLPRLKYQTGFKWRVISLVEERRGLATHVGTYGMT